MVKQFVLVTLLLVLCLSGADGQDQLTVQLDDPVYTLLEICTVKGLIPPISAVKPYSARVIRELLVSAVGLEKGFSKRELAILKTIHEGFQAESRLAGRTELVGEIELRAGLADQPSFHTVNTVTGVLTGTLGPAIAYNANLGVFLDKVDPEAFAPYDFTKTWDGFHIWAENGIVLVSDGINDYPSVSFNTLPELSLEFLDSRVHLELSRVRRNWGIGAGSLALSQTTRPIEAFAGRVQTGPGWSFHFLTGTLGNWQEKLVEQKMFSIHRLELFPFDWLYLSPWECVVWAKRLELSYMNPIMSYYMGQQINGNLDNIAYGADIAATISPFIRLYFSLFIDEIALTHLSEFFTRARNQYAWQAGFKVPVPRLPFSLLTFQYTKIEPYCYTHYLQDLSQYTVPININFSHDGENLGYHLPPNSDEFLLQFFAYPITGLAATAQYQLIRHGDGDHDLGEIEGDIDTPIDYSKLALYPPKDFLHDGIYEWIHILKFHLDYSPLSCPLTIWGEYSFIHARNFENIVGNKAVMNLFGLGVKVEHHRLRQPRRRTGDPDLYE